MPCFSFKRKEKIRKSSEFIRIYKKGVKKETQHFKISILSNNKQWSRLGISVSKKIGRAVARNRIKRRLREYFRLHKARFVGYSDIVLTAKSGANQLSYNDIRIELSKILCPDIVTNNSKE